MLNRMKAIRLAKGWSQRELSHLAGMPQSCYSLIENGRLIPTRKGKEGIVRVFGIPYEELVRPLDANVMPKGDAY